MLLESRPRILEESNVLFHAELSGKNVHTREYHPLLSCRRNTNAGGLLSNRVGGDATGSMFHPIEECWREHREN
jgi:hypothetical protein